MNLRRAFTRTAGVAILGLAMQATALASPPPQSAAPTVQSKGNASAHSAHASLRLDVARGKAWVGQAVPITLRAVFRGTEGVTLEGGPQLSSDGIFTSELGGEPHQTTEVIDGEPTLVATWSGTVTPLSPGPLELTASLPVRVRFRDAPTRTEIPDPFQNDPFSAFGGNPFDTSSVQRFFEQSMGQVREESVALHASTHAIEVAELPTDGQPATFSGAVGRFDVKASLSSAQAHVSQPITLRIVVSGTGDLDRVDLPGVPTSDVWKTYPPKATVDPAVPGKKLGRKIFEQVLVPMRGGEQQVPPVALSFFDPAASRYVTRASAPLTLAIDGVASPAAPTSSAGPPEPTLAQAQASTPSAEVPLAKVVNASVSKIALRTSPVLLLILAAGVVALLRRRRADRALRRSMRRAATRGEAEPFYRAAHALIERRLSARWGVPPEAVSTQAIRTRLGDYGEPLAEALSADEAMRFGRARMEAPELVSLCSSIERSLGGVS